MSKLIGAAVSLSWGPATSARILEQAFDSRSLGCARGLSRATYFRVPPGRRVRRYRYAAAITRQGEEAMSLDGGRSKWALLICTRSGVSRFSCDLGKCSICPALPNRPPSPGSLIT
ncbi:hypothetical protein GCM10022380_53170 [Amycolatopsis tucumanensis]|uniref:Secreted protein n=1 Tax=Amycolatopsis tucumanensis TaxID=401106 RepID=A0ABP7IVB4_9PSEU